MVARLVKNESEMCLFFRDGTAVALNESGLLKLLFYFPNYTSFDLSEMGVRQNNWKGKFSDITSVPGETIAYISDRLTFCILNPEPFIKLYNVRSSILEDYLTSIEFAFLHNRSVEVVKVSCRRGRIVGAIKVGRDWLIPKNAPYPADYRFASDR